MNVLRQSEVVYIVALGFSHMTENEAIEYVGMARSTLVKNCRGFSRDLFEVLDQRKLVSVYRELNALALGEDVCLNNHRFGRGHKVIAHLVSWMRCTLLEDD
jgi:hypothetical protein